MTSAFHPLLVTLVDWVNRRQQDVNDYLLAENRILKAQLSGHRLQLTDDQRRRLTVRAKKLGRACLGEIATLVPPDTLLRWHSNSPQDLSAQRTRATHVPSKTNVSTG